MQRGELVALITEAKSYRQDHALHIPEPEYLADCIIQRFIVIEDTQVYIPPLEKEMTGLKAEQAERIRQILGEK